ncbi:protein of unknown function [Agreia sp. COWG]|nr:protein of unknown function [Agreia sp. COWG]
MGPHRARRCRCAGDPRGDHRVDDGRRECEPHRGIRNRVAVELVDDGCNLFGWRGRSRRAEHDRGRVDGCAGRRLWRARHQRAPSLRRARGHRRRGHGHGGLHHERAGGGLRGGRDGRACHPLRGHHHEQRHRRHRSRPHHRARRLRRRAHPRKPDERQYRHGGLSRLAGCGESATASYVFTVPAEGRDSVRITVDYLAGVPLALFTGSAPAA